MAKMSRLATNRFNMINNFLVETENHDIITLLKPDLDDESIKIDTL